MTRRVLLTGATGFVGKRLYPALARAGYDVTCSSRDAERWAERKPDRRWVQLDLHDAASVERALAEQDAVIYLVHSMGQAGDFEEKERRAAELLRDAAARAGVTRIVYLGGVAPSGRASKHLRSRLGTGEVLRAGAAPTIELRAGMIIGAGGASWQMVRDLSARLPFMILPSWLQNHSQPVAIDDVVRALVRAVELPDDVRGVFDLPGPETLTGEEILERIAGLLGVRPLTLRVPVLSPRLSSYWLKLVTRADFGIAQELVEGLTSDLVAPDAGFWRFLDDDSRTPFDVAARAALAEEEQRLSPGTRVVEWSLQHLARRVARTS
jgi:uncharacterized protein YbjT (DUF2867 family)